MKQGKKPTVKQMKVMKCHGLDSEKWLVVKNLPDELHVVHRETNRIKVLAV